MIGPKLRVRNARTSGIEGLPLHNVDSCHFIQQAGPSIPLTIIGGHLAAWFGVLGGRKPTYLISATSVLTSVEAVSIVPSGGNKTDVRRENRDVKRVGFHPLPGLTYNKKRWEARVIFTFLIRHLLISGYSAKFY